jgi:hypothetical protein
MTKRNTKLLYQQASITLCKIALFLQQLEERGETYHGTTQETAQCLRDYRQASLFPFRGYRLDSCFSLADYSVLERYNLSMEDIAKVKGITKLSKDQDGNLYYRRLRGKQERARAGGKNKTREDAAFFIRHVDIEELAGNVEIERLTSAP